MIRSRKETAWKKNRKFGDVKGGRKWTKLTDNIFKRLHSLERPSQYDVLPFYIQDNPSRDFFYPVSITDIQAQLDLLPSETTQYITHIWLKKVKKTDFVDGKSYQAMFVSGSGVRLIILNAFPKDLRMIFSKKEPTQKVKKFYAQWDTQWCTKGGVWHLQWTNDSIKRYYLEHLLLHEIGHLEDDRWCSPANSKQMEDFANGYAIIWSNKIKTIITDSIEGA